MAKARVCVYSREAWEYYVVPRVSVSLQQRGVCVAVILVVHESP